MLLPANPGHQFIIRSTPLLKNVRSHLCTVKLLCIFACTYMESPLRRLEQPDLHVHVTHLFLHKRIWECHKLIRLEGSTPWLKLYEVEHFCAFIVWEGWCKNSLAEWVMTVGAELCIFQEMQRRNRKSTAIHTNSSRPHTSLINYANPRHSRWDHNLLTKFDRVAKHPVPSSVLRHAYVCVYACVSRSGTDRSHMCMCALCYR